MLMLLLLLLLLLWLFCFCCCCCGWQSSNIYPPTNQATNQLPSQQPTTNQLNSAKAQTATHGMFPSNSGRMRLGQLAVSATYRRGRNRCTISSSNVKDCIEKFMGSHGDDSDVTDGTLPSSSFVALSPSLLLPPVLPRLESMTRASVPIIMCFVAGGNTGHW
mgnify:CR=1 FL=1